MTNEEAIKKLEKIRRDIDGIIAELKDGNAEVKVKESE